MAELYDTASNGGLSEFKFTGIIGPEDSGAENAWAIGDFAIAAANSTAVSTRQISIIGVQWSINGGGNIAIEDSDATAQTNTPILLLSGNGHFHTGSHGVSFSPITLPAGKGIKLFGDGTNVSGYTVIVKIRKEVGFGYNDPR